jgi:LysM repeat protein
MNMRNRSFFIGSTALATVLLASRFAAAEGEAVTTEYTVKAGDTCSTIAASFYGDIKRIDLVHQLNPQLGPVPHVLRAGQILFLPKKPTPAPPTPDAKLTRVRNTVEVRAPEPRAGKPNDPLYRGNRVGTMASSAADLTFRDETQVKLGENTLVIIFGDTRASAAPPNAAEATVVTGNLRARLSEIAGKKADKPRVETPSSTVVMKDGEAQVSVDRHQATRLAVYAGGSTVTAQKRTVPVDDGFGSKAEMGSIPTPPKPLPAAPVWSTVPGPLVLSDPDLADVAGAFTPGQGPGDPPAEWHVQLAHDLAFDDILVDTRVPVSTLALEAKRLPPGTYTARVSAIDADKFEGKWGLVAAFSVSRLTMTPLPHRRTSVENAEGTVACSVDGGPPLPFPIVLDRNEAHALSCTEVNAATSATLAVPALPITVVNAYADMVRQNGRFGTIRVRLTDENGQPLDRLKVVAEPANGVTVGQFEPSGAPGVYLAAMAWAPGAAHRTIALHVAGTHVSTTNDVELGDDAPAAAPPKAARGAQLELSLGGGAAARVFAQLGFAGFASIGVGAPLGSGVAFASLRGFAERYPTASPYAEVVGDETNLARVRVSVAGAAIPFGYRFAPRHARVAPYLTLAPLVARQLVERTNGSSSALLLGGSGGLGLELRAGPGAFFGEATVRVGTLGKDADTSVPPTSFALSAGYRLGLF